jgi:hypothetical protein
MAPSKKRLPLVQSACNFGLVRSETCDKAEPLLAKAGLNKLNPCSSCSMVSSLELLTLVDPIASAQFAKTLNLNLNTSAVGSDVKCVVHDQPVISPCSLNECLYHTNYPGVNNCSLVFMEKHKVTSLNSLDLRMVTGKSYKEVTELSKKAMKKLRALSILSLDCNFSTVPNAKVCCNCEYPIEEAFAEEDGLFHCSIYCAEDKPFYLARLELYSGKDIEALIKTTYANYSNLSAFKEALGIETALIDKLTRKYLGKSIKSLYKSKKSKVPSVRKLVRRQGRPSFWVRSFARKCTFLRRNLAKKYGNPTLDFSAINKSMVELGGIKKTT